MVLLARFAALTTVIVIMGVLTLAATELAALAAGLKLDGGNVAVATLSMIPMGLLIAAIGYLFSGWLRTAHGYRPVELLAGDLVLHQLYWSRVELVGWTLRAVRFLLLWHAAAAWPAPLGYAGRPGCWHSGASAGLCPLCAQRHWTVT